MYIVIFKREEEPNKWIIRDYDVTFDVAVRMRDNLLICNNIKAAEILKARVL